MGASFLCCGMWLEASERLLQSYCMLPRPNTLLYFGRYSVELGTVQPFWVLALNGMGFSDVMLHDGMKATPGPDRVLLAIRSRQGKAPKVV